VTQVCMMRPCSRNWNAADWLFHWEITASSSFPATVLRPSDEQQVGWCSVYGCWVCHPLHCKDCQIVTESWLRSRAVKIVQIGTHTISWKVEVVNNLITIFMLCAPKFVKFATLTSETFWVLTIVLNVDMYGWLQMKLSVGGTCYFSKESHIEHLRPCESLGIGWSFGSKLDFYMTVYLIVMHLAEKLWTYKYEEENLNVERVHVV